VMRLYGFLFRKHNIAGAAVPVDFMRTYLKSVPLEDKDFNVENFVPGSGGEGRLFRVLTGDERLSG
jgi:hypothetical protein